MIIAGATERVSQLSRLAEKKDKLDKSLFIYNQ